MNNQVIGLYGDARGSNISTRTVVPEEEILHLQYASFAAVTQKT